MGQFQANDHYMTLGVSPQASAEEIDAAYKEAIRRVHPDVTSSTGVPVEAGEKDFRTHLAAQINAAATVLRNPVKRAAYDLDRAAAARKAAARATQKAQTAPTRPKGRYTNPSYQSPPPPPPAPVRDRASRHSEPPIPSDPKWEPGAGGSHAPAYNAYDPTFDSGRTNISSRRAADGPPRSLADWFLHHRAGQWLLVAAVAVISYLAAPVFDPAEPFIFTARIIVVFMIAIAIATRNLSNPLGEVFLALMRLVDEILNITGTNTMGKRR